MDPELLRVDKPTLRMATFECGHSRGLWFFHDEPPLTHAMCLDESCSLSMRAIVGVDDWSW